MDIIKMARELGAAIQQDERYLLSLIHISEPTRP